MKVGKMHRMKSIYLEDRLMPMWTAFNGEGYEHGFMEEYPKRKYNRIYRPY